MNRRIAPLALAVTALALAPAASAQLPINPPGNPPGTPPPAAAPAKIAIGLHSGIVDRENRWELTGDKMLVIGQVKPYVKGQRVRIELYRKGKRVGHRTVTVKKGKHGNGRFQVRLGIHRDGRYTVIARHDATPEQVAAKSKKAHFRALEPRVSGEESTRLLQIGLRRLAFVAPLNGHLDDSTRRAVLAYRKVNRYSRNYTVNS
ncbi:MAG: hypothetical protein ABR581_02330, partial [Thermoleophilaceae bacterium]